MRDRYVIKITGIATIRNAPSSTYPVEYRSLGLDNLHETRQKSYGNTLLVFFERSDASPLGKS